MTPQRPEDIPLLVPDPLIEAFLKDVDRTLLRAMLQCTATERVQNLEKMLGFAREVRRAGDQHFTPAQTLSSRAA